MKYLYGVPQEIVDKFVSLGAKKISRTYFDNGTYGDIIYFWALDPLTEIGYYCFPTRNSQIISRKWGKICLSVQKFEDIN